MIGMAMGAENPVNVYEGRWIDRDRHQPAVEIKGATLTELKVVQDNQDRWIAQCVVDV